MTALEITLLLRVNEETTCQKVNVDKFINQILFPFKKSISFLLKFELLNRIGYNFLIISIIRLTVPLPTIYNFSYEKVQFYFNANGMQQLIKHFEENK